MSLIETNKKRFLSSSKPFSARRQSAYSIALLLGAAITPFTANAQSTDPFPTCDATVYLTQGHLSRTVAMDLPSGNYKVAAEHHINLIPFPYAWTDKASLDALGFNSNDGYVYGWSQFHNLPARMSSNWLVEPLETDNLGQQRFYAGDVSAIDKKLYLYNRNGNNSGLYSVNLDEASSDYLKMEFIASSGSLNMSIEDFAVHPYNGLLYAVESNGNVLEIDPDSGSKTILGNAKIYSNFGGAFFDGAGDLYVVRNYDGNVFRVSLSSGNYEGVYVAEGPSASSSDAFRCATAPFSGVVEPLADFGDAPDSYGSFLSSDGARHAVAGSNPLRLGETVDTESDAFAYPLTDSEQGEDEDGVSFMTSMVAGQRARIAVNASSDAYLSAWIDADQDGVFDADDQVITDQKVSAGSNVIPISVPIDLVAGDSWSRFRLSTDEGLQATGAASDGEVEDHPVKLLDDVVAVSTYPSKGGWSTVAFEDNWPFVGDNDMNDLVVRMRTEVHKNSSGVTQVNIDGYIVAAGALYKNGFGIRLPGVPSSAVDTDNLEFEISTTGSDESPLEANRREAIFIIAENVFQHVTPGPSCDFYRSEFECGADLEFKFSLTVPFIEPQTVELSGLFDPFLFATPGEFHGAHFIEPPGRSYEVHLKNQSPTEAFDRSLFAGVGQDASNPDQGLYFLTDSGMPWALEVGNDWRHPYEYVEISAAYPDFPAFATSGGTENQDWYLDSNANTDLVFPE